MTQTHSKSQVASYFEHIKSRSQTNQNEMGKKLLIHAIIKLFLSWDLAFISTNDSPLCFVRILVESWSTILGLFEICRWSQ